MSERLVNKLLAHEKCQFLKLFRSDIIKVYISLEFPEGVETIEQHTAKTAYRCRKMCESSKLCGKVERSLPTGACKRGGGATNGGKPHNLKKIYIRKKHSTCCVIKLCKKNVNDIFTKCPTPASRGTKILPPPLEKWLSAPVCLEGVWIVNHGKFTLEIVSAEVNV